MTDDARAALRAIPSLTGAAPDPDPGPPPAEPTALFARWLRAALDAGVPEPHAMTLSTVGADGVPDARVLLLKDVGPEGWAFAGPASSAKGAQLGRAPVAALSFWWQPLARAVRVRGTVVEADRAESEADLQARPVEARAGVAEGDWTLWRVRAARVEFWQGRADRRHVRIVYHRRAGGWTIGEQPGRAG